MIIHMDLGNIFWRDIMSNRINSLAKSSVTYISATILGQGASFLGIILFTHLMDQGEYGRYSTYYAYVSMLITLVGVNLYFAIKNAYIDYKDDIVEFRKSVLFLSSITVGVALILLGVARFFFFTDKPFWLVLAAVIHAYSFFVVNYRMYSANMENDRVSKAKLLVMPNILQLLFSLIFVLTLRDMQYYARVIGSTIGVAICALPAYVSIMRCKGCLIVNRYWKYAFRISLPSILMSLSGLLMQQCDKIVISKFIGDEATAVYSALYYLSYVLIVVNQALSEVRQMWVYNKLGRKDDASLAVFQKWYLIIIAIMVAGVYLFAPEAIRFIFPKAYWEYEYVAPFVMSASMLVAQGFYSEIGTFHKENFKLSLFAIVAAVLNIILNCIFVPRYGAIAATYTTVISYFVLFLFLQGLARKLQEGLYSYKIFLEFICAVCISGGIYLLIKDIAILRYIVFGCAVILLSIYSYRKKNEWMRYIKENK